MIFAALGLFLLATWFLPWWSAALIGFALGWLSANWNMRWLAPQVASAAALSWMALAYVQDGRSYGLISQRMAGVFGLPSAQLIFVLQGFLGFVTALLAFKSAKALRQLVLRETL
jgi:hypothetical protein